MDDTSPRAPILAALATIPVFLTAGLGAAEAGTHLYRWVDEKGAVHYTDQIPPTQTDRGHTEYNAQGIPIQTVPPAPTREEIQRQQELERLRAQRERVLQEQKAADRLLLQTYRSLKDLRMARDETVGNLDSLIQGARANARRQQDWLVTLRSEAADHERAGKPIPRQTLANIAKAETNFRDAYSVVIEREKEKDGLRTDFERKLERFRQLRGIPEDAPDMAKEPPRPALRNLVVCSGEAECDLFWARAVDYVKAKATTPVTALGPDILISDVPSTPDEVGMTLSRIQVKGRPSASLFLDVQCKNARPSDRDCTTQRAEAILDDYGPAVTGQPSRQAGASGEPPP